MFKDMCDNTCSCESDKLDFFNIIPANIYFFKVSVETLEKGVKYVQS